MTMGPIGHPSFLVYTFFLHQWPRLFRGGPAQLVHTSFASHLLLIDGSDRRANQPIGQIDGPGERGDRAGNFRANSHVKPLPLSARQVSRGNMPAGFGFTSPGWLGAILRAGLHRMISKH